MHDWADRVREMLDATAGQQKLDDTPPAADVRPPAIQEGDVGANLVNLIRYLTNEKQMVSSSESYHAAAPAEWTEYLRECESEIDIVFAPYKMRVREVNDRLMGVFVDKINPAL